MVGFLAGWHNGITLDEKSVAGGKLTALMYLTMDAGLCNFINFPSRNPIVTFWRSRNALFSLEEKKIKSAASP